MSADAFARWKSVSRARVRRGETMRRAFAEWRFVASDAVRRRAARAAVADARRARALARAFSAGRERCARADPAARLEAHRARWARRRRRGWLRAWFRAARESARERQRALDAVRDKEVLEARLMVLRATAERDAAMEKAKATENLYRAMEFRERQTAKRRNEKAVVRPHVPVSDGREAQKRKALVRILHSLRAHAVAQLERIDGLEYDERIRNAARIGR